MAAFEDRKRKVNDRPSSSCSSVISTENGIETGYISDNSNSDVETGFNYGNVEYIGRFGIVEGNSILPQSRVVKKEFILNKDSGKKRLIGNQVETNLMSRKQGKCQSKNALMARANRIKKKQYLEDLLKKLEKLTEENQKLKEQVKKSNEVAQKQSEEIKYLKGIVANAPEISVLLKCVQQRSSLPVTSSINKFADPHTFKELSFDSGELNSEDVSEHCHNFESDDFLSNILSDFTDDPLLSSCDLECFKELPDTDFLAQDLSDKNSPVVEGSSSANVGICLHVAQQRVSVEFCPTCSVNATAAWQESTG